jgi:hypothetical protein
MKRQGGSSRSKDFDSADNNVYFHPKVAESIYNALKVFIPSFCSKGLDACCGHGALGLAFQNGIRKENRNVKFDFVDNRPFNLPNFTIIDILRFEPAQKYDVIVCNPPWVPVTLAERIYFKLKNMLNDKGVLFFIVTNTFCYQGVERCRNLKFQKFVFLPRYVFKSSGKHLLDCGILIFKNDDSLDDQFNLDCFIDVPKISKAEWSHERENEFLFKLQ